MSVSIQCLTDLGSTRLTYRERDRPSGGRFVRYSEGCCSPALRLRLPASWRWAVALVGIRRARLSALRRDTLE